MPETAGSGDAARETRPDETHLAGGSYSGRTMNTACPMTIDHLAYYPGFIPIIARWHYHEWRHLHDFDSVARRIALFMRDLEPGCIPTTFVALSGGILLGSASLVARDMDTRPDLSPWLASVYVSPAYRGRGVASTLVRRVMEEARILGIPALYLFTEDQERLYARLGWSVMERTRYRGLPVVIMSVALGEN